MESAATLPVGTRVVFIGDTRYHGEISSVIDEGKGAIYFVTWDTTNHTTAMSALDIEVEAAK